MEEVSVCFSEYFNDLMYYKFLIRIEPQIY